MQPELASNPCSPSSLTMMSECQEKLSGVERRPEEEAMFIFILTQLGFNKIGVTLYFCY